MISECIQNIFDGIYMDKDVYNGMDIDKNWKQLAMFTKNLVYSGNAYLNLIEFFVGLPQSPSWDVS